MAHIPEGHPFHTLKRIEIRKIGNPGNPNHRDVDDPHLLAAGKSLRQAVLILHLDIQIRGHAHHGNAASFFQHRDTWVQNGFIPPELIDNQTLQIGLLILVQQHGRADQLGKNAAPVDVSHQKHRCLCQLRHAHIDKAVLRFQINFHRASGTLDDDNIIFLSQLIVGFHHILHQPGFVGKILAGAHIAPHLAVYNHLGACVVGGL